MGCRCSIRDGIVANPGSKSYGKAVHGDEALGSVQAGNFLSTFEGRPYIKELGKKVIVPLTAVFKRQW
jgi:hypothetical protein